MKCREVMKSLGGLILQSIISERVKSGMAAAKRKDKQVGRPKADESLLGRARRPRASGLSVRMVSKQLNISPATLQKYCGVA